ncbi:hypothetical protein BN000_04995 [Neobacillus massiliamazoniensis]|uniref:Uncharacterized protein n=1 Tax=Neobacillus massiliamazoniensis TaxID=1499688 RepID=A0A0U1P3Z4_9BACI|nr:hypothetical protein BN000_04995 [Neobacillus massiliamazoniensis]
MKVIGQLSGQRHMSILLQMKNGIGYTGWEYASFL